MKDLKIKYSLERLEQFCQKYGVRQLSLFGSVLREDYKSSSDIDVLVQFVPGTRISFLTLGKMRRELEAIFERPVDLVPQDGLKPLIREEILSSAQVVYAS